MGGTRVEFESEHAGTVVSCPKCGHETKLYIPGGALLNSPPPQTDRSSSPQDRGISPLPSQEPAPPAETPQNLGAAAGPGQRRFQLAGRSQLDARCSQQKTARPSRR